MLKLALVFLAIALVAGLFGFTRLAGASALIAKVLFVLFFVLFLLFILFGAAIV